MRFVTCDIIYLVDQLVIENGIYGGGTPTQNALQFLFGYAEFRYKNYVIIVFLCCM